MVGTASLRRAGPAARRPPGSGGGAAARQRADAAAQARGRRGAGDVPGHGRADPARAWKAWSRRRWSRRRCCRRWRRVRSASSAGPTTRRCCGLLARINHAPTMTSITAERAFLGALDGSCRTPIAALAELSGDSAAAARTGGQPRRQRGRPDRGRRRGRATAPPWAPQAGARPAGTAGAGLLRGSRPERHAGAGDTPARAGGGDGTAAARSRATRCCSIRCWRSATCRRRARAGRGRSRGGHQRQRGAGVASAALPTCRCSPSARRRHGRCARPGREPAGVAGGDGQALAGTDRAGRCRPAGRSSISAAARCARAWRPSSRPPASLPAGGRLRGGRGGRAGADDRGRDPRAPAGRRAALLAALRRPVRGSAVRAAGLDRRAGGCARGLPERGRGRGTGRPAASAPSASPMHATKRPSCVALKGEDEDGTRSSARGSPARCGPSRRADPPRASAVVVAKSRGRGRAYGAREA